MSRVKENVAGKQRLNELTSCGAAAMSFDQFSHLLSNICPQLSLQQVIRYVTRLGR